MNDISMSMSISILFVHLSDLTEHVQLSSE